jgi:hypothetical protein
MVTCIKEVNYRNMVTDFLNKSKSIILSSRLDKFDRVAKEVKKINSRKVQMYSHTI